jgi:thymidylate kinase
MLITFSGLDGAGKTTLIQCVTMALEKENKTVAVFHMDHHVGLYACLRLIRDLFASDNRTHEKVSRKHDPGLASPAEKTTGVRTTISHIRYLILWNKPLRQCVYLVDLFIFLLYRLYIEKLKSQILIMDRYFYDRLVDVLSARSNSDFIRFLAYLAPTPSLPILLDISPEEAYARKGEFSVDYLKRRHDSYRKVFPWVRGSIILRSDQDLEVTARRLQDMITQKLRPNEV